MSLARYRAKRDFHATPEPRGKRQKTGKTLTFLVQEHAASHLHYDFRLEHRGVLLSWAVPKGPSLDPSIKRLAVHVEDHPLDYGDFEGVIPTGQYGAGRVLLWDHGEWRPTSDVDAGLRSGKLEFELLGKKLSGVWKLVRLGAKGGAESKNWLLIKARDEFARSGAAGTITGRRTESVKSGRTLADISVVDAKPRTQARALKAPKQAAVRSEWSQFTGVRRAALPAFIEPQLATLVTDAPTDVGWVYETKYDGYRMLARLHNGRVRWISRNGHDWSDRFQELTPAVIALSASSAMLDGEVVVLRDDGTTSFQDLQRALGGEVKAHLTYVVFDVLHIDGFDLRGAALLDRKRALSRLLGEGSRDGRLLVSPYTEGSGAGIFGAACRKHFEGVVAKRADAPYRSTRTREWLKLKCGLRQEFVVVGFTQPQGSRAGFGALALAVHEKNGLRYSGRVGTGFDRKLLISLRKRLDSLLVDAPAVEGQISSSARRGVSWVRPKLVAEIGFSSWTADGLVRHPTFLGLREDKQAKEVTRERPSESSRQVATAARKSPTTPAPAARTRTSTKESVAGVIITHPDRVLFPEAGITKLELARFYADIAPQILPHIAQRPLSVLRCPDGAAHACFFQKHAGPTFPSTVGGVDVRESSGVVRYLSVDSIEGLILLIQMGAIELHPWGSRNDRPEAPDRLTFDLDPDAAVPWAKTVDAARQLRARLEELDLVAFLKTTGGKGLHVVVPLDRRTSWEELKSFAHAIAMEMARHEPNLYVATMSKSLRHGRIFIDYLRNARGATAVAAYSVRARPKASVATPIEWDELGGKLRSDSFTVANLRRRLASMQHDPWADFEKTRQALSARARRSVGA